MILTLESPEARIMDVFIMLAENMNINTNEISEISFHTTQEEIANWCGMDRMKCEQILASFQKQGRVNLINNKIVVKNINDFYRIINSKRRAEKNQA